MLTIHPLPGKLDSLSHLAALCCRRQFLKFPQGDRSLFARTNLLLSCLGAASEPLMQFRRASVHSQLRLLHLPSLFDRHDLAKRRYPANTDLICIPAAIAYPKAGSANQPLPRHGGSRLISYSDLKPERREQPGRGEGDSETNDNL
jgi:hypothetical protein